MTRATVNGEALIIARRVLVYDAEFPEWLTAAAEQLVNAGYDVRTATSFAAAENTLKSHLVHAALVDVDKDGKKIMTHIRDMYPECRILIFTDKTDEQAGDVIKCLSVPGQVAHACFDKTREDIGSLVRYVDSVFNEYVKINDKLRVAFPLELITQYREVLVSRAGGRRPELRDIQDPEIREELLSVLGRLFYDDPSIQQLTLNSLKEPKGYTMVTSVVSETAEGRVPKDVVLKFGPVDIVEAESSNFDRYVLRYKRMSQTVWKLSFARMNKFAGLLYTFAGDSPRNIKTFAPLVQRGSSANVVRYIHKFFNPEEKDWYRATRMGRGIQAYYRGVLHNKSEREMEQEISGLISSKGSRLRKEGQGRSFMIYFEDLNKRYLGPQRLYFRPLCVPIRECIVHGDLHSNNIVLADVLGQQEQPWYLLDYYQCGPGHVFKDFIDLEISVRYDLFWSRTLVDQAETPLKKILDMEGLLLSSSLFEGDEGFRARDDDADDPVSKTLRIVAEIRRLARANFGADLEPEDHYWLGLFYSALRMLLYTYPTRVKRHFLLLACLLVKGPLDPYITRTGTSPQIDT